MSFMDQGGGFLDRPYVPFASGVTALTAGSVPFAGSDGGLTQDNSMLFYDNTNNRLGVGTASPASKLHVKGETEADCYIRITSADGNESVILGAMDSGAAAFFGSFTNHALNLRTNNTARWQWTAAGHFVAATDNTYDFGATGALRPRDLFLAGKVEMSEIAAPGVAPANGARLYAVDNGAGKTQLAVIFQSGAAQVLATEP